MTIHTTSRIRLTYRDHARTWLAQRDPLALGGVLVIVLIIGLAMVRGLLIAQTTAIASVPTAPLPIIMIATAPAQPIPTPTIETKVAAVLPGTLARAVVAYDAPEGRVIGAIERGRAYRLLARSGVDWLQADVTGSGVVWLRSSDVFDMPTDLADLAPLPVPQVIYQVVNQQPEQPTLTTDERAAALVREFGPSDITGGDALAAHQAREDAYARVHSGQPLGPMEQNEVTMEWARQQYAAEHPLLTSDDLPCNCP